VAHLFSQSLLNGDIYFEIGANVGEKAFLFAQGGVVGMRGAKRSLGRCPRQGRMRAAGPEKRLDHAGIDCYVRLAFFERTVDWPTHHKPSWK